MFESAELGHKIDKARYQEEMPELRQALLDAQYELREKGDFPLIILINGFDGAGRGETLHQLNEWMDPRLIQVSAETALFSSSEESAQRPWMWRYWNALPPKGRTGVFFGSWYSDVLFGRVYDKTDEKQAMLQIGQILAFEKKLCAEGALILKFWFHLSKEKQKKRLKSLEADKKSAWRVTETDWNHHKLYDRIYHQAEQLLRMTSTGEAPWVLVEGEDARYRDLTVARVIYQALRSRLNRGGERRHHAAAEVAPLLPPVDGLQLLDTLVLDRTVDKEEYKTELAVLQGRLHELTRHPNFKKQALVVVFEGNDAAGKGGAIRRVTAALDARRYRIVPIAAPSQDERAKPWLWRFWRETPKKGGITIFDRSWYGRVLVERVENFCSEHEWMRAYNEINNFEQQLVAGNIIVVKFWLAISSEEQLKRFKEREETGFKRFKITEEDWRNREKWDQYKDAVCDMIDRTSTQSAPWTLVEANNKLYARLKILRTLCNALESRLLKSNG
ncbi:polyphosphate:AMP phosphotransferase [Aquaspirillum soli]